MVRASGCFWSRASLRASASSASSRSIVVRISASYQPDAEYTKKAQRRPDFAADSGLYD